MFDKSMIQYPIEYLHIKSAHIRCDFIKYFLMCMGMYSNVKSINKQYRPISCEMFQCFDLWYKRLTFTKHERKMSTYRCSWNRHSPIITYVPWQLYRTYSEANNHGGNDKFWVMRHLRHIFHYSPESKFYSNIVHIAQDLGT